jgi:glycosyltransferase involved in cell wall biosynthesis
MSAGVRNVFIQAPECLIAAHDWGWDSLCYMFHGLGNSVAISRYPWARRLSKVYEAMLYRALRSADVILAAAGQKEVAEFRENAIRRGVRGNIASFPTRVDTAIFRPVPASNARRTLGFPAGGPVIAVSGRLSRFKGWELMLDAFVVLRRRFPEARLVFIGDGEQRDQLLKRTSDLGLESSVSITGFQAPQEVAAWLNAADLLAVASFVEGWSVAMLEALSCGKPIVTTDVSGAAEMIVPGKNGLIVYDRSPDAFGEAMERALTFPNVDVISTSIARRFAVETLRSDLGEIWPSARQSAFI